MGYVNMRINVLHIKLLIIICIIVGIAIPGNSRVHEKEFEKIKNISGF